MNEIISKIRAEIERLLEVNAPYESEGYKLGLFDLLSFLNTLEEPVSNDLEDAAEKKYPVYLKDYPKDGIARSELSYDTNKQCRDAFIVGAKWQREKMMKDIPKWYKVQRGSCFDKHTNFILSAREGHFYCSSMEVPRDGYILLVDELERLPKED